MKLTKLLLFLGIISFLNQTTSAQVGIGTTTPTANLHISGSSSAAKDAPLKFDSGAVLTVPENGAIEYDGTNYYATSNGTRYTLAKSLTGSGSLNFPSIPAAGIASLTITVTDCDLGDPVALGIPAAALLDARLDFQAWVSSKNIVTIRVVNLTLGALDPPAATFKVAVLKF